ncbi:hypothetical protein BJP37_26330 [Moorena bouillonii PNG]|uniref:Transposase n=1 Tax=Moorena bouillonii PNG TaxID=568701 RepID=A0A1U7NC34_9CYAN|nr:hypothetical protein BJP37_26330 [Moorena bouillonii PNG]
MPEKGTSFVMTNLKGNLKKILGDLYGLRTWVEYAFRQCKQELGWTDSRFTKFKDIEKWWEILFCVYTMISLNSPAFLSLKKSTEVANKVRDADDIQVSNHQQWNHKGGWKNVLNNFRLLIQPIMMLWIIFPWLDILPNSNLLLGLNQLISEINQYQFFFNSG